MIVDAHEPLMVMATVTQLEELAHSTREKIVNFAKTRFKSPKVEDLGDYIPFLAYFGEIEFCEEHISKCSKEIFNSSLPTQREDTLLGLLEFCRWTRNEISLSLAMSYVNFLFSNYCFKGQIVIPADRYIEHVFNIHRMKTTRNKMLKIGLKFLHSLLRTRASIPRNGIFIELLVDMYDLTRDKKYLFMAEDFASVWLRNKFFQKFGLFPSFRLNPFESKYVVLAKDNAAILNGLTALYATTLKNIYKDSILKWFEAVHARCFDKSVYGRYCFGNEKREQLSLMYAFAVVDALCDAFFVLRESRLLSFAEEIAKFWIDLQSKIGLFPMTEQSHISHQDYTNDFSISLWRLYELTGKNHYLESSERAMEGLFKFHAFNLKVDYQFGGIVDASIIPKYVFLMSKPIILLEEKAIYKNKKIFKLLRDR